MMTYKLSKPGQIDLVFGLLSDFISMFVHARLQVSLFSGHDLCHPD